MCRVIRAAVLIFTYIASPCFACTCIGPQHEWAIRASTAIFAAEVLANDAHPTSDFLSRYALRVFAVWKGDIPESTYVDAPWSGACGYPFEVGHRYLIYMSAEDMSRRHVHLCSGTSVLEALYYDRYLLGEPVARYDPDFETVTLETLMDLMTQAGSEIDLAWQFSYLKFEAPLLLPRLLRIATGHSPGNQVAALRAIGALGTSAESAYAHLGSARYSWNAWDPAINAERILAMASVCRDFDRMNDILVRAISDENAVLRCAAIRSMSYFDNPGENKEIARILRIALSDRDAEVRTAAVRSLQNRDDPESARRVKKMSRSDSDDTVRAAAREYLDWQHRWSSVARAHGTLRDRGLEYKRR